MLGLPKRSSLSEQDAQAATPILTKAPTKAIDHLPFDDLKDEKDKLTLTLMEHN